MQPDERGHCMVDSVSSLNLKRIGLHLPRPRSQRGQLSEQMPKRGKLARGRYWARWRIYVRQADGSETTKRIEKIIDRTVAEQMGFVLDYGGPLTKTDTRQVLERLIRESNAASAAFIAKTTFGELAREYIDLNKPTSSSFHLGRYLALTVLKRHVRIRMPHGALFTGGRKQPGVRIATPCLWK